MTLYLKLHNPPADPSDYPCKQVFKKKMVRPPLPMARLFQAATAHLMEVTLPTGHGIACSDPPYRFGIKNRSQKFSCLLCSRDRRSCLESLRLMAEMTAMVCFQLIGYDSADRYGSSSRSTGLNVMMPLIAYNLIHI